MAFVHFQLFLGFLFKSFCHELIFKLMEFQLHFALFLFYYILCIHIKDICEHVKLDSIIQ